MRFPTPALATVTIVLSLALAGCGSSDPEQGAVASTEAPTTSTTIDPFAVPEVIDAAYVDKVLGEHWRIRDAVTLNVVQNKEFSSLNERQIRSIFSGDLSNEEVETFTRAVSQDLSGADLSIRTQATTEKVLSATSDCIKARVNVVGAGGSSVVDYRMEQSTPDDDNLTGWRVAKLTLPGDEDAEDQC